MSTISIIFSLLSFVSLRHAFPTACVDRGNGAAVYALYLSVQRDGSEITPHLIYVTRESASAIIYCRVYGRINTKRRIYGV